MENNKLNFLEEYLQSVDGMQEAETKPFFYTRLQAAMQKEQGWQLPLKPTWIVSALALLLLLNGFIVTHRFDSPQRQTPIESNTLQGFADAYDLTIHSTY